MLLSEGAKKTLIESIREGDLEEMKRFLRDRPQLIHGGDGLGGCTPLHYAVMFRNPTICNYLISNGADRASADATGAIAAHYACRHRNRDVLCAVCTADLANKQDDTGATPLHICAEEDNVELGRILIREYKADPNIGARYDATPLLLAFDRKNYPFCKFLIENGAEVNVRRTPPGAPHSPLHYTLFDPLNLDLAELLLQKGADPYAKGVGDVTPFEMAQRHEKAKNIFKAYTKDR